MCRLTLQHEATGFGPAIQAARNLQLTHIVLLLHGLITRYGCPRAIRCVNGGEMHVKALKDELKSFNIRL